MDKRYQVFISSTFADLEIERKLVMEAIISLNCFPAGMEMFPATDMEQLNYIKGVIDKSDYYILILAGRYGSLAKDGISYTEKEYNYARKKGIPILAFIRKNINSLPNKYVENDEIKLIKLNKFRDKVKKGRLVSFWEDSLELKYLIYNSLMKEFTTHPREGWIRENDFMINTKLDDDYNFKFKLHSSIDKELTCKEFLKNKEVRIQLAKDKNLPIGYNINTGLVYSIDLSKIFCYVISGKRRSGKTNALKILISAAYAKGDDVYVIELTKHELKNTFMNTNIVIASNVDEIYDILNLFIPVYKERNVYVLECIKKGYTNEEIFMLMQQYPRIHVFIEDLVWFIKAILPKKEKRNIYGFLENIISKGHLHNIYYYYSLNQSCIVHDFEFKRENLYDLFINDAKGIHFGGELDQEHILHFQLLGNNMRDKIVKPGIGLTRAYNINSKSIFVEDEEFFVLLPIYK